MTRQQLAVILVVLTFLLIFWGGQVTTTDSGDSVPSWPASFFVPKDMAQVWELGHRWFAGTVGIVAVVLGIWTLMRDRRTLLRRLAIATMVLVVVQALIGGLRVLAAEKHIKAVVHALVAQAFLACVVAFACALRSRGGEPIRWVARRGFALAIVTWLQVGLGAVLRHETRDKNQWGLVAHLAGAMLVIIFVVRLVAPMQETTVKRDPRFRIPKQLISLAIVGQLVLGLSAYVTTHTAQGYVNPTDASSLIPTLHLVLGSALLALSVLVAMRAHPLDAPASVGSAAP